ncbi:hypothetical protein C0993_007908 [Termitomyces sp. T159_Od127]|nr:hypothetical protein C0993_007908 [Termitomyces sp. T159_Od127]
MAARLQPPLQESMEQSLLASTVKLHPHLQEEHMQSERKQGELIAATMDWNQAQWDWNMALAAVQERDVELTVLRAQVAELELRVVRETPGEGQAVGIVQAGDVTTHYRPPGLSPGPRTSTLPKPPPRLPRAQTTTRPTPPAITGHHCPLPLQPPLLAALPHTAPTPLWSPTPRAPPSALC